MMRRCESRNGRLFVPVFAESESRGGSRKGAKNRKGAKGINPHVETRMRGEKAEGWIWWLLNGFRVLARDSVRKLTGLEKASREGAKVRRIKKILTRRRGGLWKRPSGREFIRQPKAYRGSNRSYVCVTARKTFYYLSPRLRVRKNSVPLRPSRSLRTLREKTIGSG